MPPPPSPPPAPTPARIRVKLVPGATRNRVVGWLGDELKLTVTAPPESGKANAAAAALLADFLGVPPAAITLETGASNPHKVFRLTTLTSHDLETLLGGRLPPR
jgi:uncharacterized protein